MQFFKPEISSLKSFLVQLVLYLGILPLSLALMNNEQLEDWIASLNELWKTPEKKFENWRKIMMDVAPNMQILINYMSVNFEDVRLSQPIIAQLLALYYKLGLIFGEFLDIVVVLI